MAKRRELTEPLSNLPGSARLDWNDLAVFLALTRHRNLSETARFLGVNHTTIGRRIRALESQLNQRLFERSRLGFLLTEAGYNLLQHAEGMEEHAHSIAVEFSETRAAHLAALSAWQPWRRLAASISRRAWRVSMMSNRQSASSW